MVLRDRDTNGDGTLDERLWVVQDANYNVTALFDNAGNVVERYVYDPFGQVTVLDANWSERAAGSQFAWLYLHQGGRFDTSGLAFANPCAMSGMFGTGVRVINGIQAIGGSLNAGDNLAAGNYGAAALDLVGVAGNSFQMLRPCFPGEVQVLTRRGWVRWDALTTNDEVLSLPEQEPEGELAYRPVEEVFRRRGVIWEVTVAGQILRTTAEHPFWVRGKGWTAAKDLQIGDELRSHDGQWLAVEGVRDTGREEAVYNCRVAEYHTYFVGDAAWGWSLWAHNACTIEQARAAAARHGGVEISEGRFLFPTRRSARQAASESAGDLGPSARPIRLSEFEGGPWWTRNSNRVIGRRSADGTVGWRDDFLGHPRLGAGPHVNVWGPGEVEFHLFYYIQHSRHTFGP